MITAYPTKHGTGIQIWGDYGDLNSMYDTVSKYIVDLNKCDKFSMQRSRLITYLCYEIRHAFQGDRDKKIFKYNECDSPYYGFRIDWITYIVLLSCIKGNLICDTFDELDISNIKILEYWGKVAMKLYDPIGAEQLIPFIENGIPTDDMVYFIQQYIDHIYLLQKPSITRFRNIHKMIVSYYLNTNSEERKNFTEYMKREAKRCQCEIDELDTDYEDIACVW